MSLDFLVPFGPEAVRSSLPMGGLGAGMISFAQNAALESVSIQHHPSMFHHPVIFASLHCRSNNKTRIIQSQNQHHKIMQSHGDSFSNSGNGSGNHYGLPSYKSSQYSAAFPFAQAELSDDSMPVQATVTGWSPFIPGDDVNSGLPCAILEYELHNTSSEEQELVFGFHCENFLSNFRKKNCGNAKQMDNGFYLESMDSQSPSSSCCPGGQCGSDSEEKKVENKDLYASIGASILGVDNVAIDCGWFRSGWFDKRVALWDDIRSGELLERPSHGDSDDAGASIRSALRLAAGARKKISIIVTWYKPEFKLYDHADDIIRCWYGNTFDSISQINKHIRNNISSLRDRSSSFAQALQVNDMPESFRSSVSRNLAIFKSPSFLRAHDGTLWGWEGCHDNSGCCNGSCTHVYNYTQALAFLFPQLERQMRDVEFNYSQEANGFQHFRASLPLDFKRPEKEHFHAAADGQLGGIIRAHRDWIITGSNDWLRSSWPAIKQSLEYCIKTWDPKRVGRLAEPHHNTYDIEFWGEDGLCSCIYAGALKAAINMAEYLEESAEDWANILSGVQAVIRDELFDGWIRQRVHWDDLEADNPYAVSLAHEASDDSPEAKAVIEKEGPRYQYGEGVLLDAALGCQTARLAGLGAVIDEDIEAAQLDAIMQHNFKDSLHEHACFQRPAYAIAEEAGTIMCSWPAGGRLSMPFPYSDEVWTGCEHQFAAHLCMFGRLDDAIKVEEAVCARYDGRIRNPFNEIECGHFYVRALASYGLVPAFSGARYNANTQIMELKPCVSGDFVSFFAIGSAWGHIGVRNGQPFLDLIEGELVIKEWDYSPIENSTLQASHV